MQYTERFCSMAKNDYFVVVYRILTYLYACFQARECPNLSMFGPDALQIGQCYWTNIMESMSDDGLIKGIEIIQMPGSSGVKIVNLKITSAGIEYLLDNGMMEKAKRILLDIKSIMPGF